MFYATNINDIFGEEMLVYKIYDTITESGIDIHSSNLIKAINKNKIQVKNIKIKDGEIEVNKWYSNLTNSTKSILMYKEDDNKFHLISNNMTPSEVTKRTFKRHLKSDGIANCKLIDEDTVKYECIDTYEIIPNTKFTSEVESMYSKFIAKTKILGYNNSFKYSIKNNDVVLTKYTGTSKNIIIPSFITAIGKEAFKDAKMEQIKLNSGLKYIGKEAFFNSLIEQIEIPDTVEYIFSSAFFQYKFSGLMKNGEINTEKVKINGDTLIL